MIFLIGVVLGICLTLSVISRQNIKQDRVEMEERLEYLKRNV